VVTTPEGKRTLYHAHGNNSAGPHREHDDRACSSENQRSCLSEGKTAHVLTSYIDPQDYRSVDVWTEPRHPD